MRLLTFILIIVLNYSCNGFNSNQQKQSQLKTEINELPKSEKINKPNILSFDIIKKIFIECVSENYKSLKLKENENKRVKKSYGLVKPFSLSTSYKVVRMIHDNEEVYINLILYLYENKEYKEALQMIENDPIKGEIMFGKNWDRIIGIDSKLIRVDSGCTLSEQNWNKIIHRFEERIEESYEISWDGYNCKCGSLCKKE